MLMIKTILMICLVILISTTFLDKISNKFGVPILLAFIFLGMIFGEDGLVKIQFADFTLAEDLSTIALIFIMFYGGFGTNWDTAKPVAIKSSIMASAGVIGTCLVVGFFCHYALHMDMLEGMLLGAVVSSTDAASVFSILRSKDLSLKYNTDSLLEMESGSNDPFAYLMTVTVLSIMKGEGTFESIVKLLFVQIVVALIFSVLISFFAGKFINRFTFEEAGFQSVFVIAIALLSYALPSALGGNGFLCSYIVGIALGNALKINKKSLVHTFDGLTGLMQILIFFLLGLLSTPVSILKVAPLGLIITVFMVFVARPLVTYVLLRPFKAPMNQILLVSWAGLRGAASIVFAMIAVVSLDSHGLDMDLFHIVFCLVIISILLQGTTLGFVSKKLNMIDPEGDVLKTFNDYSDEMDMDYISVNADEQSKWVGKKIMDIGLPKQLLLVLIERDGNPIIPKGETVIEAGDKIVLSASRFSSSNGICLREVPITKNHKWAGNPISDIEFPHDFLIIIIKRKEGNIVPNGNTIVKDGDILIFNMLK